MNIIVFLYGLAVVFFFAPATVITYRRIRKGAQRFDKGVSKHIVNNMLFTRKFFGAMDPWLYYGFHTVMLLSTIYQGAFIVSIALIVLMVYHYRLWALMQQQGWAEVPAISPDAPVPPPIPAPLTAQQQIDAEQANTRA